MVTACPYTFGNYELQTKEFDPKFKLAPQSHLRDVGANETYNGDSADTIRLKMAGLFIRNIFQLPLQLFYRTIDIIFFKFRFRGVEKAYHNHLVNMSEDPTLRGRACPKMAILKESLKELGIAVSKLALFIPGFLIREVLALNGIIFPLDARKLYARVDKFFYIKPLFADKYNPATPLEAVGELTGYCMQTFESYKELNLFRFTNFLFPEHSDPKCLRTEIAHLKDVIQIANMIWSHSATFLRIRLDLNSLQHRVLNAFPTDFLNVKALHEKQPIDERFNAIETARRLLEEGIVLYAEKDASNEEYRDKFEEARNKLSDAISSFASSC